MPAFVSNADYNYTFSRGCQAVMIKYKGLEFPAIECGSKFDGGGGKCFQLALSRALCLDPALLGFIPPWVTSSIDGSYISLIGHYLGIKIRILVLGDVDHIYSNVVDGTAHANLLLYQNHFYSLFSFPTKFFLTEELPLFAGSDILVKAKSRGALRSFLEGGSADPSEMKKRIKNCSLSSRCTIMEHSHIIPWVQRYNQKKKRDRKSVV